MNKWMKRAMMMALVLCTAMTMTACGDDDDNDNPADKKPTSGTFTYDIKFGQDMFQIFDITFEYTNVSGGKESVTITADKCSKADAADDYAYVYVSSLKFNSLPAKTAGKLTLDLKNDCPDKDSYHVSYLATLSWKDNLDQGGASMSKKAIKIDREGLEKFYTNHVAEFALEVDANGSVSK